jgi:chromosome segregation ATPase
LNQLFFVFQLKDLNVGEALTTMEAVSEYADHRTELVEKVRSMGAEKASLLADIASLKGRIAVLELERCANTLETELQALKTEKAVLEEKASTYEAGAGCDIPPSTTEGLPV